MKESTFLPCLHKIICSLAALFQLNIMKVVTARKVSSVLSHAGPSFLYFKREHKV